MGKRITGLDLLAELAGLYLEADMDGLSESVRISLDALITAIVSQAVSEVDLSTLNSKTQNLDTEGKLPDTAVYNDTYSKTANELFTILVNKAQKLSASGILNSTGVYDTALAETLDVSLGKLKNVIDQAETLDDKTRYLSVLGILASTAVFDENLGEYLDALLQRFEDRTFYLDNNGYPRLPATWRTKLGLGSAAVANVGTEPGNVPAVTAYGYIPASVLPPRSGLRRFSFSNTNANTPDVATFISLVEQYGSFDEVEKGDFILEMGYTDETETETGIVSKYTFVGGTYLGTDDPYNAEQWLLDVVTEIDWLSVTNKPAVIDPLDEDENNNPTHRGVKLLKQGDIADLGLGTAANYDVGNTSGKIPLIKSDGYLSKYIIPPSGGLRRRSYNNYYYASLQLFLDFINDNEFVTGVDDWEIGDIIVEFYQLPVYGSERTIVAKHVYIGTYNGIDNDPYDAEQYVADSMLDTIDWISVENKPDVISYLDEDENQNPTHRGSVILKRSDIATVISSEPSDEKAVSEKLLKTTVENLETGGSATDPRNLGDRLIEFDSADGEAVVNLTDGEIFQKIAGSGVWFSITNPVLRKQFRLVITGISFATGSIFENYDHNWKFDSGIGDYDNTAYNTLWCEILSAYDADTETNGVINLFWE